MTGAELRVFAGWEGGSRRRHTYICRGADIGGKLLRIGGVKDEAMEAVATTAATPKDCARCQTHNPPTAKCYKCGAALDLKTVMGVAEKRNEAVDELMELVAANPQILEAIRRLVAEKVD